MRIKELDCKSSTWGSVWEYNGDYYVQKWANGKLVYFGRFRTAADAMEKALQRQEDEAVKCARQLEKETTRDDEQFGLHILHPHTRKETIQDIRG